MASVMIGVDPHKSSHTAVAVGADERQLGKLQVRASAEQARQLVQWAASWPERTWAVEGASGLGHLLAQQLVAAGEQVLDVQPKLGSRVRLLASGNTNKTDPNDARSVAIALCARLTAVRSSQMITLRSCRYGPSGTGTWHGCATRSPAGSTPCCASWSPAVSARRSPQLTPPAY